MDIRHERASRHRAVLETLRRKEYGGQYQTVLKTYFPSHLADAIAHVSGEAGDHDTHVEVRIRRRVAARPRPECPDARGGKKISNALGKLLENRMITFRQHGICLWQFR